MLLLSILCRLLRCLLGLTAVLVRRDLSKDVELRVLRHETPCCAARSPGSTTRPPTECGWALSRLAAAPPRDRGLRGHPATVVAWHRGLVSRKGDYTARRRPGRSPTAAAIKKLVMRRATENPHLRTPARAGRTGLARPSDRRLPGVADPA
jgi:putative transposase